MSSHVHTEFSVATSRGDAQGVPALTRPEEKAEALPELHAASCGKRD